VGCVLPNDPRVQEKLKKNHNNGLCSLNNNLASHAKACVSHASGPVSHALSSVSHASPFVSHAKPSVWQTIARECLAMTSVLQTKPIVYREMGAVYLQWVDLRNQCIPKAVQ